MSHYLLENALTNFPLISHTSCVGSVVQMVQVSSLCVRLVFEIFGVI